MTSPHKIVINVDIGMLLTWNFQKTLKTKFGSLENCGRPEACRNFSILKEKFWQGKIYPPPWRIGLMRAIVFLQYEWWWKLALSILHFWMLFIIVLFFQHCSTNPSPPPASPLCLRFSYATEYIERFLSQTWYKCNIIYLKYNYKYSKSILFSRLQDYII